MKLEKGKTYRAYLRLNFLESKVGNQRVVKEFTDVGFSNVLVVGNGKDRMATGTWTLEDKENPPIPKQVWKTEEVSS